MNTRKRPLNIGLGKMLSQSQAPTPSKSGDSLRHISIELIQRGQYQPRKDFDPESLEELAQSIKAQGILQPVVLRQIKPQQYELIAGERRWRAAQLAGLSQIPAIVKEITDQAALAIGLIENIQRENLNALEEAMALERLIEEFQLTHEDVAAAVGKSRTMVSNLLRLLQLDDQVKQLLTCGDIEMGHARALLSLSKDKQRQAAKEIVNKQLSVRQAEALVKFLQQKGTSKPASKAASKNVNLVKIEQDLSDYLGTSVNFVHQKSGRGKIVINYTNLDILDGILKKIK